MQQLSEGSKQDRGAETKELTNRQLAMIGNEKKSEYYSMKKI